MRTVVLLLIYVILTFFLLLLLLVFWPFGIRDPLLGIAKWAMSLGSKVLGLKVKVSGRDQLDRKSAYIFMANHLSFLDGPLLFWLIPRSIRVILKKEVFRIPVIGVGMRYVGFVPVDRKSMRGGKRSIAKAIQLMKKRGYSFLIFPEGTRSRDGRLQAFKRGGFVLALESKAPIVPVTINGTYELMPCGRIATKRGLVNVFFHPPVPVEGYDQSNLSTLIDKVKGAIESGLRSS
ncbi:MAG: lysophospholipid acyltransferase family protein [Clostridiales bacterium]|nr:lysophospholipid acyltransferase family protein [Clostridiales bacterium]